MSARPYGPLAGRCHFINRPITSWHGQGLQGLRRHGSKPVTPTHHATPASPHYRPSAGHLLRRERREGGSVHICSCGHLRPAACSPVQLWLMRQSEGEGPQTTGHHDCTAALTCTHSLHGCVFSYRTWYCAIIGESGDSCNVWQLQHCWLSNQEWAESWHSYCTCSVCPSFFLEVNSHMWNYLMGELKFKVKK